jgi:hypothetical protein
VLLAGATCVARRRCNKKRLNCRACLHACLHCSPRKTLHRVDRSQLQLPDPLPGLTHQWIETEPGIR